MSSTLELTQRVAQFQKQILILTKEVQDLKNLDLLHQKNLLLFELDLFERIGICLENLHDEAETSVVATSTEKALERLRFRMQSHFNYMNVSALKLQHISDEADGVRVVETRSHSQLNDGHIIEVIHQGYRWNNQVLHSAEVIAVKN